MIAVINEYERLDSRTGIQSFSFHMVIKSTEAPQIPVGHYICPMIFINQIHFIKFALD